MSSLPKLNIEGLLHPDVHNSIVSPVTPATADNPSGYKGDEFRNKRRRVGGLSVSALVNEKDDETPAPYPWEYQPRLETDPVTTARPPFPSILSQMSGSVTELEERSQKDTLPSLQSLGLPTCEQLQALDRVSVRPTGDVACRMHASAPKSSENETSRDDEALALKHGKDEDSEESAQESKGPSRKRKRAELDAPVMTESEIESLIETLREKEKSRSGSTSKNEASDSSEIQAQEASEKRTETQPSGSAEESSGRQISDLSRVLISKNHRRGRPNGDNRPRQHTCPTCNRRFLQQSGVVSHYRVVHLKEKRFECPHKCGLRFGARGDVSRHVDTVHNKLRNFECQVCGDAFARKSILTRHCKNMHNDVFGADEAHDCVHGCVSTAKNRVNDDDQRETKRRKTIDVDTVIGTK
ncbi:zinc finger protein [Gracilaria domingensis]|nr:zinc finger protein [Gracilaria domingensis]